jgi:hypothetical protein
MMLLLISVTEYAKSHNGELPNTGMEIFKYLMTEEGYRQYKGMTKQARFDRYSPGINRITGKFYDSFQSADWTPGGIYIEQITDENVLRDRFSNFRDKETKGLPTVWKVRVYGERPGSVVKEQTMLRGAEIMDNSYPGILSPMPEEKMPQGHMDM